MYALVFGALQQMCPDYSKRIQTTQPQNGIDFLHKIITEYIKLLTLYLYCGLHVGVCKYGKEKQWLA